MRDRFLLPIVADPGDVANGGRLKRTTPMSAILFGPPGTSKTQLAEPISQHLGWPLLSVDPSYLVQDGMDHLYSRANKLFAMLTMAEQIVVLLDEFDEMGRDRSANTDILSRFITTAMLPKLAAINKERKIVFLLATTYVSNFDAAFSRGGRFDMIIQVMPPTLEAKLARREWKGALASALETIAAKKRPEAESVLADLTFLEMEQLVARLPNNVDDPFDEIAEAGRRATMARKIGKRTRKAQSLDEEALIRLPGAMRKEASSVQAQLTNDAGQRSGIPERAPPAPTG